MTKNLKIVHTVSIKKGVKAFFPYFLPLTLFLFLFTLFFPAPSISSISGKSRFKAKCLNCHKKKGEARMLGATRYASIQWVKFFKKNKHKRKKDIGSSVSPEDLVSIQGYLVDHAADSDRPEAAGLR